MTTKLLLLAVLVGVWLPATAAADTCDEVVTEWRQDKGYGKKSLLFDRMPEPCQELVYARPGEDAGSTGTPTAVAETTSPEGLDLRDFYLRADLGMNAPTGFVAVSAGRRFAEHHSMELSLGRGSAANFVSASYRVASSAEAWSWFVGGGGSVGFSKNAGYDPDQHDEDPTTTTTWIHGEAGGQRLGPGTVVLLAFGVDRLMSGTYHVDLGDINLVDEKAGSVAPYVRIGLGFGF